MITLGLTGSIGMGKSTTAQMFRDAGVPVWDADAAVHRLYALGGAAVGPIGTLYPDAIVGRTVSRRVLKDVIAQDRDALRRIEDIVHPLVAQDRAAFLDKEKDAALVVFDIPLLYETGADAWLDKVLVVTAPPEVQKDRVLARGTMSEAEFEAMLARQMPDAAKRDRADFVIETLTLDGARAAVHNVIEAILGDADA